MSKFCAVRDKCSGFLRWVFAGVSSQSALQTFDDLLRIDPQGEGLEVVADRFEVIELSADQYQRLVDAHGTDPEILEFVDRVARGEVE